MEAYEKYFDILELPYDAAIEDVHRSYNYLKKLYSGDSLEITALTGDFTEEISRDYLARLDEAYQKLREVLESRKPATAQQKVSMDKEMRQWIREIDSFSGAMLRDIRNRLGIGLNDIYAVTRIQPEYLESIESENFEAFRAEAYLRSYLIEYTRFLGLDSQKALDDYLPRYRSWAETGKKHNVVEVNYVLTKSV